MTVTQITDAQSIAPTVNIAKLLDKTRDFLTEYVSFTTDDQPSAVALWVAHTHAFDAAETTPRLAIQSATPQAGKTRLLELLDMVCRSPVSTSNISAAALFRMVSDNRPTLLIDEVDTIFSARGKGREDLRGLLNAGYRAGSTVARVIGGCIERHPVFCPVALAGIGRLPDTVQDRSIVVTLKRRGPDEKITRLRRRDTEPTAHALAESFDKFAKSALRTLRGARPNIPEELSDRAADVWEPLLAIADLAGGGWPALARHAAVGLSAVARESHVPILTACREAFREDERISSVDLIGRVRDIDSLRFGDLTARSLATHLRPFDIAPKLVRDGEDVFRGYTKADFADAFARYC